MTREEMQLLEQDAATEADTLSPFLQGVADLARDRLKQITARTRDVEQTVARLTAELDALRLEEIDAKRVLAAAERRQFGPSAPEVAEPVADVAARAGLPVADPPRPPDEQPPEIPEDVPDAAGDTLPEPEPTPEPESAAPKRRQVHAITEEWLRDWAGERSAGGPFSVAEVAEAAGMTTVAAVRHVLAALVDAGVLEQNGEGADLRFSIPDEPKPEKPPAKRQTPVERDRATITEGMVRDLVVKQDGEFSGASITRDLGYPTSAGPRVNRFLRAFAERGMIRRPPGSPTTGKSARWEYVDPKANGGPTRRPRKEPKIPATEAPSRGTQVPHTRERGRSGRPGYDRKRAERGVKVKRHTSK